MNLREPVLDVHDIQGNILAGFNKDFQKLVFLSINQVGETKTWLTNIQGYISSTAEVLRFNRVFRSVRLRTAVEPQGLVATWCNIAFSHAGIAKLTSTSEADALPDNAFRIGMPARATALLGDPSNVLSPSHPNNWKVGGTNHIPDILLIVASDEEEKAAALVQTLLQKPGADSLTVVWREDGAVRADMPGFEHFGFKDGISQPGVRGRASKRADDFITPRLIDSSDPLSSSYSRPGQPLIMPGHFVLGYKTQDPTTGAVQRPGRLRFHWFKNGSFLIVRRLRQDVAAFREFVATAATELAQQSDFSYVSIPLFASLLMGRWPNGAPITRSPDLPAAPMAADIAANAFAFVNAMPGVKLKTGIGPDASPPAPADPLAILCPHWAHIRKVNPRDDITDLGDEFDTLTRRVIRRGIPYGPPLPEGQQDDGVDRGLLFVAYHASIEQSFEKITADWVNQTQNPSPDGHDPVIGQTDSEGNRQRYIVVPSRSNAARIARVTMNHEWVLPTGGGYFFAPSLSAIATRLLQ